MKLLVFSDSHGETSMMIRAVNEENPDAIIHLGDLIGDARDLGYCFPKVPLCAVGGNGDSYDNDRAGFPDERVATISGKRFFITHGHNYSVKSGLAKILAKGEDARADFILFGHTHQPFMKNESGIWLLNPGKANDGIGAPYCSYGVVVLEEGAVRCAIVDVK